MTQAIVTVSKTEGFFSVTFPGGDTERQYGFGVYVHGETVGFVKVSGRSNQAKIYEGVKIDLAGKFISGYNFRTKRDAVAFVAGKEE